MHRIRTLSWMSAGFSMAAPTSDHERASADTHNCQDALPIPIPDTSKPILLSSFLSSFEARLDWTFDILDGMILVRWIQKDNVEVLGTFMKSRGLIGRSTHAGMNKTNSGAMLNFESSIPLLLRLSMMAYCLLILLASSCYTMLRFSCHARVENHLILMTLSTV